MEARVNREFKDRLFRLLFGTEEYKENIVSLYNALNGTNYADKDDFTITTIGDVIYISMKNDVSLLVDSHLSLWEQQSTYNPNMPIRGLMYFGRLYDSYIKTNKLNIYGSKLVKLPVPEYVVLYNGDADIEAIRKLKLSDAFMEQTDGYEWTAVMYNLNKGRNEALLERCKPLAEYMHLVNLVKENLSKGLTLEDAVNAAVDDCIGEGVLENFLVKHKSEVLNMVLTEYDEKAFVNAIREEGREEGLAKGREEGRAEVEIAAYKRCIAMGMSEEDAISISGISTDLLKLTMQ